MNIFFEIFNEVNKEQFTKELEDTLTVSMKLLINETADKFNFSLDTLRGVVITDDIAKSVENFAISIGENANTSINCVGKVYHYYDDLRLSSRLFLHLGIILSFLFADDKKIALNTVIHEMSHIHEGNITEKICQHRKFGKENAEEIWCNLQLALYRIAIIAWQEFYAVHTASAVNSYTQETHMSRKKEIEEYINYLYDVKFKYTIGEITLSQLYKGIQEIVSDLLIRIAYICGEISDVEDFEYSLEVENSKGISKNIIIEANQIMLKLYRMFPEWSDISILDEFTELILKIWEDVGIIARQTETGVYLGVY